ncbi:MULTISPECIES: tRNA-uridine aminocarboxypropyltransferase [Providencia]|uniref:tRNA-uridine aminocarboxypropyltransferase n=1 Tax=Providencia TaxID=586 RepID=UPI00197E969C|nr:MULTISPECIES: tRNA-uridine aminocarboxypropyltransferase [Providencia]MBN4866367.1 DTW domain-containing protein [Providencia stuartii]MBN4875440.1 DTW domain-containing protein [Providencia stuartii]MBN4880132.1 DTW domain-containing protein [Providencia stuartii]MBN4884640.1 DTW domain-containing protein [Providencia stuartii]HEM8294310.1 DTW domain-containing protein [Providencia stuartii]
MTPNAVYHLRQQRLALSTKPFKARGCRVKRCQYCLLPIPQCLCQKTASAQAKSQFCLIMFDGEVFKPSNTGKLIADVLPDTLAFQWSRTAPDALLLAALQDDTRQPYLIFPESYAQENRVVVNEPNISDKPALFILLDGTWPEARKMFRKSPYLNNIPMLSINTKARTDYLLRTPSREEQHCTAEVAATILELAGDIQASQQLFSHFSLFRQKYLEGKPHHPVAQMVLNAAVP